jgi:N-acetylglucosamine-6-phosphate deacetylase
MSKIKMITLAPEIDGAKEFIEFMKAKYPKVILSIGHSNANYSEAKKSFSWGITHATHLFNAMNSYHHREPGIVGAVFDSSVTCDIIADLIHSHPSTLELTYRVKKDKLILITDSMRAGCMKCGTYSLGGHSVEVKDGKATLSDGTLAGSVLKLNEALLNMYNNTSMGRVEVIDAVTKLPARKLALKKGELKVGYDADIVIFDEKFSIISTIVSGKVKYKKG